MKVHQQYAPAEMNQLAVVMLEQMGLGEHQHKYPEHLSGGQKQRVAIAIAFRR
ncbi:MAG: ATP-binding cassette domain-containing protein [Pseudanabaena sp. ELA645]